MDRLLFKLITWTKLHYFIPWSNYEVDKAYIDEVMQDFAQGDILILQNEISNIDYIIEVAKAKQMKIYLNPSPINENLNKYDMQQ